MTRDAQRLVDILACAGEVAGYLADVDMDDFIEDRLRQRAIERVLTIIGEAAKQLSEETRAQIKQPWREIIRFRDKGIHAYDSLSPASLYRIATESVPKLAKAIEAHDKR